MHSESRREFLKRLGAVSTLLLASRSGLLSFTANQAKPFEFLVIGDSVIWGQGLEEKDKFYTLTADWLRNEAFGARREVNLKVKAHSGSTLKFHPDDAAKYKKAGRDETHLYKPEVNIGFPSSWKQVEVADDEYSAAGKNGADLIMICGGITDITTSRVFDPNGDDEALKNDIKSHCQDDMYDVLDLAATKNPNAKLAVIGYFPAISPYTTNSKIFNAWLEIISFPRPLKIFVNNPLTRRLFFKRLKTGAIRRSRIWLEESDTHLQIAVDRINEKHGAQRAVFIKSPFTEENAAEAPKTLLFRMGKGGVVKDPIARERIKDCREALPELKRSTGIEYSVRLCELAGVGHPDPAGARLYAEAIKSALAKMLTLSSREIPAKS